MRNYYCKIAIAESFDVLGRECCQTGFVVSQAMVVFSNQRLGPAAELLVSESIAVGILRATADAARPFAEARWEHELVRWLEARASNGVEILDVGDIAWTPEHFERQRRFLLDAIVRATATGDHTLALDRWRRQIEAHPATSVQVGRRWNWQPTA